MTDKFGMADWELECLKECIELHIHTFYTCAEVGVEPHMESFILNVFETCEEYEDHPTLFATRRYITTNWDDISKHMIDETAY